MEMEPDDEPLNFRVRAGLGICGLSRKIELTNVGQ